MSKNFEKVKHHYDKGLWSVDRVREAVVKQWITEDEFELIVGYEY